MDKVKALEQAINLVSSDRQKTHGTALENHNNIALSWSVYLNKMITPHDVAIMMALLKIARTKTGSFNADDYTDGAAYLAIAGELREEK